MTFRNRSSSRLIWTSPLDCRSCDCGVRSARRRWRFFSPANHELESQRTSGNPNRKPFLQQYAGIAKLRCASRTYDSRTCCSWYAIGKHLLPCEVTLPVVFTSLLEVLEPIGIGEEVPIIDFQQTQTPTVRLDVQAGWPRWFLVGFQYCWMGRRSNQRWRQPYAAASRKK